MPQGSRLDRSSALGTIQETRQIASVHGRPAGELGRQPGLSACSRDLVLRPASVCVTAATQARQRR